MSVVCQFISKFIKPKCFFILFNQSKHESREKTYFLNKVNFITEDKMLWLTYLYENILFTNKRDAAFIKERKDAWDAGVQENRVALIKSLITQDRKVALGAC